MEQHYPGQVKQTGPKGEKLYGLEALNLWDAKDGDDKRDWRETLSDWTEDDWLYQTEAPIFSTEAYPLFHWEWKVQVPAFHIFLRSALRYFKEHWL